VYLLSVIQFVRENSFLVSSTHWSNFIRMELPIHSSSFDTHNRNLLLNVETCPVTVVIQIEDGN
jgi:hypothetical protein